MLHSKKKDFFPIQNTTRDVTFFSSFSVISRLEKLLNYVSCCKDKTIYRRGFVSNIRVCGWVLSSVVCTMNK